MLAISQLLLTRFWWNFKGRFLWTFRTDSNYQGDICPHNIYPRDICPYQEYLSSNWPDFDETLKIGSWEHLEQIPTVMVTFVQATFILATFVHIRNISALTDPIWWNFKDRFLGTSRTDSNCHGDICPGNICPRDICPYQEYLRSNRSDFDETSKIGSWEHLEQIPTVMVIFVQATFVQVTFIHIKSISAVTDPMLMKL